MGLQEIRNERFENSEVMGKYWSKQDSEVLKYTIVANVVTTKTNVT